MDPNPQPERKTLVDWLRGLSGKTFSSKPAKVLAAWGARYLIAHYLVVLSSHGVLPSGWATSVDIQTQIAVILTMVLYEVEEEVWQHWQIDIPSVLAKIYQVFQANVQYVSGASVRYMAPRELPSKDEIKSEKPNDPNSSL